MISTVTISTISTVTTVAAMGLTAAITVAAIISLIAFLISRELTRAHGSVACLSIARFLCIGIIPLTMAFTVIVTIKVFEVIT